MPLIPVPPRHWKADLCDFKDSLIYIVRPCLKKRIQCIFNNRFKGSLAYIASAQPARASEMLYLKKKKEERKKCSESSYNFPWFHRE